MTTLSNLMMADPWYARLSDPTQLWGDIMFDYEAENPNCWAAQKAAFATAEAVLDDAPSYGDDILDDYVVPDLRMRKGIWENFPVDVVAIRSTDDTERYRISWNMARLEEMRQTEPESMDEWEEYQDWCHIRLMHSLGKYSNKYTVEPALNDSMICVIAMVHGPRIAPTAPVAPVAPEPSAKRALDVLRSYPISWDRDGKVHRIKLHRVNAAKTGATEASVRADLKAALATCSDCTVTAGPSGFMMTVTML